MQHELAAVSRAAKAHGVDLSVTVTDLSGRYCRPSITAGADHTVKAASVIKLALLAELMDMVDHGELSLTKSVHIPAGSDNIVGGSGNLQHRHFPLDITIGELMTLMVQVSDNTATNVLIDQAGGFASVDGYIRHLGYRHLWLGRKMIHPADPPTGENWIDSREVTDLLAKIWKGEILSQSSRDYIVSLMKGQQVSTKYGAVIPRKYLANKTGELDDVSHDSGIITLPGHQMALATTTSYPSTLSQTSDVNPYVQRTARIVWHFAQHNQHTQCTGAGHPASTPSTATPQPLPKGLPATGA